MSAVLAWAKTNPTRVAAIAVIVIGWLAIAHVPGLIVGGLGSIVGILTGTAVYAAVTPVAKAADAIKATAIHAAEQVAEQLTPETVGAAGALTTTATSVAAQAAIGAADDALQSLGVKRKH